MDDFVPTRVSRLKKDAQKDFLSVNYEAPKKKPKKEVPETNEITQLEKTSHSLENSKEDKNIDPRRQQELEMKRARYDVIKFGMSGFEKKDSRKAKVALAISLGAMPPKKQRMNYKRLKDQRTRQKEAEKKNERVSGLGKSLVKHKNNKKFGKKKSNDILGVYGKVERTTLSRSKS